MTDFQKITGGLFIAARAGRGGGLVLLPFMLAIMTVFWVVGVLSCLLVRGISSLAHNVTTVRAGQRGL